MNDDVLKLLEKTIRARKAASGDVSLMVARKNAPRSSVKKRLKRLSPASRRIMQR
jgi:hypothetical protein